MASNMNLPGGFTALKGLVTGTSPMSLGKAIQQLGPGADAKAQVKKANGQARNDLNAASAAAGRG